MAAIPPKQQNVKLACELAWQALQHRNLDLLCANTGAVPADGHAVSVAFLNETCLVDRAKRIITAPSGEALSGRMVALILHYLNQGDGTQSKTKDIGFPQIPGANFYEAPFRGRIIGRLIRLFGEDPALLLKCGMDLAGRKANFGDAAMTFHMFPNVPVTIVVWRGDDEFPPNANVVFDASVANYLPIEDVVIGCEEIVNRLTKEKSVSSGESAK